MFDMAAATCHINPTEFCGICMEYIFSRDVVSALGIGTTNYVLCTLFFFWFGVSSMSLIYGTQI